MVVCVWHYSGGFRAPEWVRGQRGINRKGDVYSVGCVLAQVLLRDLDGRE
jgi:serine/threonine protein kinase